MWELLTMNMTSIMSMLCKVLSFKPNYYAAHKKNRNVITERRTSNAWFCMTSTCWGSNQQMKKTPVSKKAAAGLSNVIKIEVFLASNKGHTVQSSAHKLSLKTWFCLKKKDMYNIAEVLFCSVTCCNYCSRLLSCLSLSLSSPGG